MTAPSLTYEDIRKFWTYVRMDPQTHCWEWDGHYMTDKGNGRHPAFWLHGTKAYARRVSFLIHFGTLPPTVATSCGNMRCVNPQHLLPRLEANHDTGKKLTGRSAKDWKRMSPGMAREVLTLREQGLSQPAIARQLGITQSRVCMILKMTEFCRAGKLKPYRDKGVPA